MMSALWLVPAALLVLSGFLSASEAALMQASRAKLRERDDPSAQAALALAEEPERLTGAMLLGRALAQIMAASLATRLAAPHLGGHGLWLLAMAMAMAMAALVLVLAEAVPRALAALGPERLACAVAPILGLPVRILAPPFLLARRLTAAILALFGLRAEPGTASLQDEIADALAQGHSSGAVQKEARDRLLGALDLGERAVEEIMLHRSRVEMVDATLTPGQVLDQVLKSPHTRLPVYRGERENVVGVIHAKDLLRGVRRALHQGGPEALARFDVLSTAMPPYFVPETTPLDEQMREFLKRHTHFALVVDEYGSLRGLITLEDILEEIVGEITDEHDTDAAGILAPNGAGDYLVDGGMTIRDLNRALDWDLPDDEANTVAGLVIHMTQSIPLPGQVFSFHGFRFQVVTRRENRITRLRIRPPV
ncbi:MAG: CNNM domain-containing protein [Paracoccus sp. (in: a-proteobacteria)]|uniref:HlyC/CorC family transporter n=1 Tax=Paracoccus sp. TaxID=267 RepID=UPI0039E36D03